MNIEEENRLLKDKIRQLISDNLELAERLEHDYNPDKCTRKLTLQEKLAINMGNLLLKYRISKSAIKNIYGNIAMAEKEPEYIDLTFDNNRMFKSFHFVDLEKEAQDIEQGEALEVDLDKIPDGMPELQQKLDVQKVLNQLTDTASNEPN